MYHFAANFTSQYWFGDQGSFELIMTCENAIGIESATAYVNVELDLEQYLTILMDYYVPAPVPLGELLLTLIKTY